MTPDAAPLPVTAAPATTGFVEQVKEGIKTIGGALLIAVALRSVLIMPFNIPSGSMIPRLLVGDYLFVSKWSYGYSRYSFPWGLAPIEGRIFGSAPARGDVAVFKDPKDNSTDYIKRVIGLPGDQVQMKGGVLFINGLAVPKVREPDFVVPQSGNDDCSRDRATGNQPIRSSTGQMVCSYPQFRETLPNGRSYDVIDLGPTMQDNTDTFLVPAGHYFMMGDNRDDSEDSRFTLAEGGIGYVPEANLVGHARVLWFSLDGNEHWYAPWTWPAAIRFSRIGTVL